MSKVVRVLNISPKVQQQINDDRLDSYPTTLRTGDQRTLGNNPSTFFDDKTSIFTEQTVNMPFNTTPKAALDSGFKTGSINIVKSISPASQYLTKFTDDTLEPYNTSKNPSSFFKSDDVLYEGFPSGTYPGFTAKTRDQICIEVDITPASSNSPPTVNKQYSTKDSDENSGFAYFNFDTKTWDYVGKSDPALGTSTGYKNYFSASDVQTTAGIDYLEVIEGQERLVGQFTTSPAVTGLLDNLTYTRLSQIEEDMSNVGYDKIGYPTSFFQAPAAPRYHAKKSQGLKLSDYIAHPFVLESIEVHLPVKGTRYHGAVSGGVADGFGRDIDNHVFFLYRQSRTNATADSVQDVSGSLRSLIANQSFCFYNGQTFPNLSAPFSTVRADPIHENDGQFDYNMLKLATGTKTLTKNLVLKFKPRIYDEQVTAPSIVKILTVPAFGLGANSFNNGFIKNFWVGGTQIKNQPGVFPTSNPVAFRVCDPGVMSIQGFTRLGTNANPVMTFEKFTIDPRTLRSNTATSYAKDLIMPDQLFDIPGAGGTHRKVTSNITNAYRETPVVLMPEDELIFGIEAGFYSTIVPNNIATWNTTDLPDGFGSGATLARIFGSDTIDYQDLTMLASEAKVYLFGTLIRDGTEKLAMTNQNLSSNSIHEVIHEVVVDQFQIAETAIYSSSYIDNYVTGTMGSLTNPRTLVGRATSGNLYPDFGLSKFVTLKNFSFDYQNHILDENTVSKMGLSPAISRITSKNPVAIFRYDHYGQFRDMLEQRIDSKGTETTYSVKNFPNPDFIKTFGTFNINGPVQVLFTSQSSEIKVDPLFTRSCNLSTECTASLPYYDDEISRNRSNIVFTENPPFKVTTIVLNQASTLLSTKS